MQLRKHRCQEFLLLLKALVNRLLHLTPRCQVFLLRLKACLNRLKHCTHPKQGYWNRVALAYNCNDLKELHELEVLVNTVLNEYGEGVEISIPDIDIKIDELKAEIERILTTDPYMYKHLLESRELIEEKKNELNSELDEYKEYENQLKKILKGFIKNGVRFTWEMED